LFVADGCSSATKGNFEEASDSAPCYARPPIHMKIKLNSIMVEDQDKALKFYTGVLRFKKSKDIPVGEFRWITLVSPEGHPDVELALEPNANPAGKTFQEALLKQGIPATAFEVDDIEAEAKRLKKAGVKFTMNPTSAGELKLAVFADTCGNLIQIYQPPSP
jgi:glyoxylase I family protein